MKNKFRGEVNPVVILKTILFVWLFTSAVLVEIALLPFLLLIKFIFRLNNNIVIKTSKFIIENGLYFLCISLKDFRKQSREIAKRSGPRIYILNHCSFFDIILLFILPDDVRILVKESYTKIPILGAVIKLNGHIVVGNAADSDEKNDSYDNAIKAIKDGSVVVIFPEGTRSKDGNMSRFKTGAFKLAYETQAELVPVVIDSWNTVRPGDSVWFREHKLYTKVLGIRRFDDYKDVEPRELAKSLKNEMTEELTKIRDFRRNNEKNYYRNREPFKTLDANLKDK